MLQPSQPGDQGIQESYIPQGELRGKVELLAPKSTAKASMATKLPWRPLTRSVKQKSVSLQAQFHFSACVRQSQDNSKAQPSNHERFTHFGYKKVTEKEKEKKVGAVFSSVATSYDRMNDLMSLGIHRLWKDYFVRSLNPGFSTSPSPSSSPPPEYKILDIAGGTGDIAFRLLHHAHTINSAPHTTCTISDINPSMLAAGRARAHQLAAENSPWAAPPYLSFLLANAEDLSSAGIASNSIDLYTVAFGIRNFTDKAAALREAHRVLKPGGVFACLEFSSGVTNPVLDALYKRWSFGVIPLIGQLVTGDRESYQYLVESIQRFPRQAEWRDMIVDAGFVVPAGGKGWEDLSGGIAAIHKGVKPVVGG